MDNQYDNTSYSGYASEAPGRGFDSDAPSATGTNSNGSGAHDIGFESHALSTTGTNSNGSGAPNIDFESYGQSTMGINNYSSGGQNLGFDSYAPSNMGTNDSGHCDIDSESYHQNITSTNNYNLGGQSPSFDSFGLDTMGNNGYGVGAQSFDAFAPGTAGTDNYSTGGQIQSFDGDTGYYNSTPAYQSPYQSYGDNLDEEAAQLTGCRAQDATHYPEGSQELGLPNDAAIHDFDTKDSIPFLAGGAATQSVGAKRRRRRAAGASSQITTVERNGKNVKLHKQPQWDMASVIKHTPLAPKGTKFQWSDNTHISRSPVRKGIAEPDKLRFEAIDSKGSYHERFFHKIDENKWDDSQWITDANKWRSQTIRRLFKTDPDFKSNKSREKWSKEEINYFWALVLRVAGKNKRVPVGKDWDEITDEHNREVFGSGAGTVVAGMDNILGLRTSSGLRTKYKRFPDLIDEVEDIVRNAKTEAVNESNMKIYEKIKKDKEMEGRDERERKMMEIEKEARKEAEETVASVQQATTNNTEIKKEVSSVQEAIGITEIEKEVASVQEATNSTKVKTESKGQ